MKSQLIRVTYQADEETVVQHKYTWKKNIYIVINQISIFVPQNKYTNLKFEQTDVETNHFWNFWSFTPVLEKQLWHFFFLHLHQKVVLHGGAQLLPLESFDILDLDLGNSLLCQHA